MTLARLLKILLTALVTTTLVAGCASIPQSGQVGQSDPQADISRDVAYTFNPVGPAIDAIPTSIIRGFILAATGIQGDFSTAREFLTEAAASRWDPTAGTTIYSGSPIIETGEDEQYTVELTTVGSLDDAGVLEVSNEGTTQQSEFRLEQLDGQWRIDELPDGINLDAAQFRALFNTQTLYFYDPTYEYMVPDLRWMLNTPDQTVTIVQALLNGPATYLEGAVVSAFPPEAELYQPAIPVSSATAQVDLTATTFEGASVLTQYRMYQQLDLTLQRYPGISDVTLSQERATLDFSSPPTGFIPADATVTTGNTQVGVNPETDQLVSYEANTMRPLSGYPNVANLQPTDPTTNRERDHVAFLNPERDTLYIANNDTEAFEIATGQDLTAPSMDVHEWVFTVTDGNTIIAASTHRSGQVLEIMHPWAGRDLDITALRVSPEGTRVAVVVQPPEGPGELYVAGIIRDGRSQPQALGNTFRLQTDEPPNRVAWFSTAEILAARVSERERVEIERVGFSGPSINFKPMLGMVNFSTGAGNVYAETEDNVYLRVGNNWRAQQNAPTQLSYPG